MTKPATAVQLFAILMTSLAAAHAGAAPTVQTLYPAAGQADACTDTPLRIMFDGPVTVGTVGKIELFDASNDQLVESIDIAATLGASRRQNRDAATTASTRPASRPASTQRSPATTQSADWLRPISQKSVGGTSFTYFPIQIAGNIVQIDFAATLVYGKSYYVRIAPGVFKADGEDFPGMSDPSAWRFSVRPAPEAGKTKIVVAADASGDFNTVQGAVDSVPDGNTTPTTIFIKNGYYPDLINFENKHALTFVGEHRKKTVLLVTNNNSLNGGNRGVFNVRNCNNLVLSNLTVRNLTPLGGSQAETLLFRNGDNAQTVITGCDFYSTQDTLQLNGQTYVSDCYIEGTVDFIWGTGPCFFENTLIRTTRTAGYYTQVRNRGEARGFVFYHCTFDGTEGITRNVFARIRPSVFPDSECVLIECKLGPSVSPRGFLFDGKEEDPKNTRFFEYGSVDLQGKPADVSQRAQSRQLKQPEDAELIRNYSDASWVLGGWKPAVPAQPAPPR